MSRVARAFCVLVWLGVAGTAYADEDENALVEAGKKAIKSVKPLAPGAEHESYFEITLGPDKPVGYVAVTLKASGSEEEPVYHYKTATGNTFPNGKLFRAVLDAKLRPNFEPIEMEMKRTVFEEGGDESSDVQTAKFGPEKVELTAKAVGSEETKREEPRPEPPFIYGIETLVQLIDFDIHKKFILREFDLQTGKAGTLTFNASVWNDGTTTVIVTDPAGNVSYQFWYDDDAKLLRWGVPSMPIMFVRSTKEKVRRLGWEG